MQPPSENTGGTRNELRSDAKQLGTSATNRLYSEVDNRKGAAADQAKTVSSAIETAAGELDGSAPAWLKSSLEQGARQIQKFADAIEQKDSRQLTNDVRDFARNSPGAFLAGCAAAGFAAARIFKAGEQQASTPTAPEVTRDSGSFQPSAGSATSARGEFV